jgi:NAD(P)-dependent dehydrogenase (short-subunit alcohol dehydrogenase family)
MDLGVRDRAYLLTGGSAGLGYATAQELVAEGARVVITGLPPSDAARAAEALGGVDRAIGVTGDNSDPVTADMLVQTALHNFGRLDGAVISVGGPPPGAVMDVDDAQWRSSFERSFSARSGSPAPSEERPNMMLPSRSYSLHRSERPSPGWRYPMAFAPGSAWLPRGCPMSSAHVGSESTDSCPHGFPPRAPSS